GKPFNDDDRAAIVGAAGQVDVEVVRSRGWSVPAVERHAIGHTAGTDSDELGEAVPGIGQGVRDGRAVSEAVIGARDRDRDVIGAVQIKGSRALRYRGRAEDPGNRHQAIRIIAVLASAVGNCTVNVPEVTVLSAPKS